MAIKKPVKKVAPVETVKEEKVAKKVEAPVEKEVKATKVKPPARANSLTLTYPDKIPVKGGKHEYIRQDKITFAQLKEKVVNGTHYPMRILTREERADKKITELIVVYVGKWVHAIDINSVTEEWFESLFRVNEGEFASREMGGNSFAVYEKVDVTSVEVPEVEEDEEIPVVKKHKAVAKK